MAPGYFGYRQVDPPGREGGSLDGGLAGLQIWTNPHWFIQRSWRSTKIQVNFDGYVDQQWEVNPELVSLDSNSFPPNGVLVHLRAGAGGMPYPCYQQESGVDGKWNPTSQAIPRLSSILSRQGPKMLKLKSEL